MGMTPEPWLTARIDQVAADTDTAFELIVHGDFWISVDHETGEVEKIPRPQDS